MIKAEVQGIKLETTGSRTYKSMDDFLRDKMPHIYARNNIDRILDKFNKPFVNENSVKNELANFLDDNNIDPLNFPEYLKNIETMIIQNLPPEYVGRKMSEAIIRSVF